MKKPFAILIALSLLALHTPAFFAGGAQKDATNAKKEDWKSLFDGKTLTGWKSAQFGGEGDGQPRGRQGL